MPKNVEAISDAFYTAADQVAVHYEADILVYSGPIDSVGYAELIRAVLEREPRKNCLLILTTSGGDLTVAYQIARFLHRKYAQLFLCSPRFCKSAGTLIAIGAHKLLIDEYSEFGPVDTSIAAPFGGDGHAVGATECFEWVTNNAIDMFEAMMPRLTSVIGNGVRLEEAARLCLFAITELMRPVTAQINVMAAGANAQSMAVAEAYGQRLAEHACNMGVDALHTFIGRYPSHDFIIDYAEMRTLFTNTEMPSGPLYRMLNLLGDDVYQQSLLAVVRRVHPSRSLRTAGAQPIGDDTVPKSKETVGEAVARTAERSRGKPTTSSTKSDAARRTRPEAKQARRRPSKS